MFLQYNQLRLLEDIHYNSTLPAQKELPSCFLFIAVCLHLS